MHHSQEHNEHRRTQFQIDRIAFFSDAVIAIAITLMVLEIKIPAMGAKITLQEIVSKHGGSILVHITALFLSYLTIGNLWIRHHELYEHIVNYDKRLIKLNLYFLLSIILLPVSISFFFTNDNPMQLRMIVYFMNLALCYFTYYLMTRVVYHSKTNFSAIPKTELTTRRMNGMLSASILFVVVSILVAVKPEWFYYPFIAAVIMRIIRQGIAKRQKKKRSQTEIPTQA